MKSSTQFSALVFSNTYVTLILQNVTSENQDKGVLSVLDVVEPEIYDDFCSILIDAFGESLIPKENIF